MAEALAPVHVPKQAGKAAPAKMRKLPRGVMEALAKKGAESERLNMERGVQPKTTADDGRRTAEEDENP